MLALDAALNASWAMERDALERLLDIAARQNDTTPEMLEAYRAKTVAGAERLQIRDKVAILSATGPLFKRANLMTALSGATSYDILRRDLQAAADAGVASLLLNVDSPGGEASGTGELAQAVYEMRDRMRIVAYVGGMGASAGYWLASAAHEIVVDSTALLGSIGVQWAMVDNSAAEEKAGRKRFTFISSQSPMKNADPGSEAGAAHLQAAVDAQAQVFVETVARNRGVDTKTVLSDFGKGGIFVGQDAVNAGLADRIGNFESVLAELSAGAGKQKAKGAKMSDEANTITAEARDAAVADARTDAVKAEKARVAGLRTIAAGFGSADADLTAAIDGDMTVEAFSLAQADVAAKARAAQAAKPAADKDAALAALKNDEEVAAEAAASTGKEPEGNEDTVEAVAARISAA